MALIFVFLSGCAGDNPPRDYREGVENVILIVVDTLAAQNLGFMGYERNTSPVIDGFSQRSIVFERAYTPKALTLPAFTSLFSGQHVMNHNVQGNGRALPENLHLLTRDFSDSGFFTIGFAASRVIDPRYGIDKGFEHYFPSGKYEIPAETVIEEVRNFLENPASAGNPGFVGETRPLFMFIHFFDTHTDYKPDSEIALEFVNPDYKGPVDGRVKLFEKFNNYEIELNSDDLRHVRDLYDAEIRTFDTKLEDLFYIFEQSGLMDNSLIVLTADHGENLGEHHYITHGHPYEPGLHIPLMFRFPDDYGAGTEIDKLVELTDVVPTLMDIAGIDIPSELDGQSLLPLIEDPSGDSGGFRDILIACGGINNSGKRTFSLFDGKFRLIKDIRWSDTPLLYDISIDPKEENDISGEHSELVELYSAFIDLLYSGDSTEDVFEYDFETLEMLRSLGYVQ